MTHVTFGDDISLFVKDRNTVGAVPCTVLTPDAGIVIMNDDSRFGYLDVRLGRTAAKTLGVYTVVTAHGVEHLRKSRKISAFHLTDTAPFDIGRIVVLFVTGHFTTTASDTFDGIEVKAVLLTLFERWNIDGV
jgi:hypothetical protein